MFADTDSEKENFLVHKKTARLERALDKQRDENVVIIQKYVRGYLARKLYQRTILYVLYCCL